MKNGPILVTAAESNPVTTAEAKTYCLITDSADDTIIAAFVSAATDYAQRRLSTQFIQATFKETWDCWPCDGILTLERHPIASVSSVKYYDTNGTQQTVSTSNYWTDLESRPPRIFPVATYSWPDLQDGRPAPIEVRYVAGYAGASSVPASILTAIKALVKHWYDNRAPILLNGAVPQTIPYSLEQLFYVNDRSGYC